MFDNIYYSSKIPFKVIIDENEKYISPGYSNEEDNNKININDDGINYEIIVNAKEPSIINLFRICLKNVIENNKLEKKKLLTMLLEGSKVEESIVENIWPEINKKFILINICTSDEREDIFFKIKNHYLNTAIEAFKYDKNIIIIGSLKEKIKEVNFIKEIITADLKEHLYISYCEVKNYIDLKKRYEENLNKVELAQKYNSEEVVFDDNSLMLEKIVDSISEEIKDKIYEDFYYKLSTLDEEMIKTVEIYFKCGLNASSAAKELYIHRNTLLYRLEKIQKITTYDIRKFDDAILLKIFFLYMKIKK